MEKDRPLPKSIPFVTLIAPFLIIGAVAGWFTWRLDVETPLEKQTITLSRLYSQDEITCEWPKFSIWDRNQLKNSTFVRSIECPSTQPSFASLDSDGHLTVTEPYSETLDYSEIKCFYRPLLKDGTSEAKPTRIQFNSRSKAEHDQFVVNCVNGTTTVYEEAFFSPTAQVEVPSRARRDAGQFTAADPMNPSIAILLIDDVSSAVVARNLPKTMTLMRDEDFFVPSRYSQSYSDAASNLELLLNGNDSTSLVELMKARGCLTLSNEESLPPLNNDVLLFPSADMNTRPLHEYNQKTRANEYCLANGKSTVSSVLSPLLSFSSSFRDLCTLSLTRLRSPRNRSLLGSIDEELSSALSQLLSTASNTAIFVISPSGLKGQGLSGAVESKSPLLSAWFPAQFRMTRNEHYSTFAWNMDKLITTRDVRETLRQLAEGSLPDFVEWKDWDEEHLQATSLLGEMLPEERNCTTLNIPDENCLCLGTDEKRNATLNADGILYKRVFDLVESRALQEPCIETIEEDKRWFHVNAYRLFEKEVDEEASDVEWLTIKFYVRILERNLIHGGNYGGGSENYVWFKAMVRHYISTDRLEYVEAIIIKSGECFAVNLERLCSMCYSTPFWALSAPGPNKGFLLDTATAVI